VGNGRVCSVHPLRVRRPWANRPTPEARGYLPPHARARLNAQVLAEETVCGICYGLGLADDEVDHRRPLSKGGTNDRENLRRTHRACNQRRGARS